MDLEAKEDRRRLCRMWLGLPNGVAPKLPLAKTDVRGSRAPAAWAKRGDTDGRLGKARVNPEGCPPERLQDYFKGWAAGQEALMRGADLTREAFAKGPGVAGENGLAGVPAQAPVQVNTKSSDPDPGDQKILVLKEADFATGSELDDANLRTLVPERREAFDAADRVVAVFGAAKRVIKEPDENCEGGYYIDDGVEAPVSDPVPADAPLPAPTAAELT